MQGFELDRTLAATPEDAPPGPEAAFTVGSQVAGRYRIVRFVGAGGAGEVYEAEDLVLGNRIALKAMKLAGATAMASLELQRFVREITLARKVTHPNVCRVHDVGEDSGHSFLTMEFLVGETLAERLRRGPLSVAACERIARDLIAGLAALHAQNIVHRDFKSSNVMLARGDGNERAVVTDFGLAKSTTVSEDAADLTGGPTLLGTPAYMAPEQVEGRPVTFASDIYALGVVLFEMLTGTLPFREATALATAAARLTRHAPRASERVASIPRRWDAVIAHCLERDPARRPANVLEVLQPTRQRRRISAIASITTLGVIGVASGSVSRDDVRPEPTADCASAANKLIGIWDPITRAQVAVRFGTSAEPFVHAIWRTLAAQFDDMTTQWSQLWNQACAAEDRGSDPLLYGQRLSCLESERMELRAYASVLGNTSVDVETFAIGAPPQFPITPPSACTEEQFLRGQVPLPPVAVRPAIEALMIDFHRLRAEARFATFQGSIEPEQVFAQLTQLEQRAEALGYPTGQAEIEFWHGVFLCWFGRSDEAARVAERVIELAEATRDDPRLILGLVLHVSALTSRPGTYDAATTEAALARATDVAARLGRPQHILEWIEEARVDHLVRIHDPGIEARKRHIELRKGAVNYALWARAGLAKVRAWNGEAAEVLPEIEAILAERERFSGPWSIDLGEERLRQATAFALAGDVHRALDQAERAVAIFEPAFHDHAGDRLWAGHLAAAGYAARLGATTLAERHIRAAVRDAVNKGSHELAAYSRSIGALRHRGHRLAAELAARIAGTLPGTPADTGLLAAERAELAAETRETTSTPGDARRAVAMLREQREVFAQNAPWQLPDRGDLEARLGIALLATKDLPGAIEHLEEAIWIHGTCCSATAVIVQDARLALARALWERGDHERARQQARLARDVLVTMGPALADKARHATAWLAAHP